MKIPELKIIGITGIREIECGDDLAELREELKALRSEVKQIK